MMLFIYKVLYEATKFTCSLLFIVGMYIDKIYMVFVILTDKIKPETFIIDSKKHPKSFPKACFRN